MTLAQVVRLVALARSLPEDEFEVHFAAAAFDPDVFEGTRFRRWPIWSVSPRSIDRAVRSGLRPYSEAIMQRYVEDDLHLIASVRPDVIAGDLRWSLAVSGPRSGVQVAALANACWSPFAVREFPLPEHPIVALLGESTAAAHFPRVRPAVFRWFARPLDRVRERYGLAALGSLERVITWGDVTLYADPPGLHPMRALPASHRFVGHVHWAPDRGALPETGSRPLIYVTLGSSGPIRVLPAILEALAPLDLDVLLATAGRPVPCTLPANVRAAKYVRGDVAAERAAVVVCNGGASTAYQALAAGTPVVGLPLNLDQALVMSAIERARAGILVRCGAATAQSLRATVCRALHDVALRTGARRVAASMKLLDARIEFRRAISDLLHGVRAPETPDWRPSTDTSAGAANTKVRPESAPAALAGSGSAVCRQAARRSR